MKLKACEVLATRLECQARSVDNLENEYLEVCERARALHAKLNTETRKLETMKSALNEMLGIR